MEKNKVKKKLLKHLTLENEVISAVVVLYCVIFIVMVVVHYIQPSEQKPQSSSTSPSHIERNFKNLDGK